MSVSVVNQWTGTFSTGLGFTFSQPFGAHIQLSVGNSDGNWLIAYASWQCPGFATTMAFGDDAENLWVPLGAPVGTSSAAGNVRTAIWAAPNAAPASVVWASPSDWAPDFAVTVIEVSGMGPGLSLQAVDTAYANAATSVGVSLPAPSSQVLALAAFGAGGAGAYATGPGGSWTSLPPVNAAASPRFGAYIDQSAVGATDWNTGRAAWQAITGIPLAVARWYKSGSAAGPGDYTLTTSMSQMAADGTRMLLTLKPPYSPVSSSEATSMAALLATLQGLGASVRVTLWHEPANSGLTADQYVSMVQFYAPYVRQYYPLWVVYSGSDAIESNGYYPGDAWVDGIAADCYATSTADIDNCATMADGHGKALGLWEFNAPFDLGVTPSPVTGVTSAQGITFLQYIQSLFTARLAANKPCGDISVFSSGGTNGGGTTGTGNFLGSYASANGGFETTLGNWIAGALCSVAHSTAQAHSGAGSMAITCSGGGTSTALSCSTGNVTTQGLPVTAGQSALATAWTRAAATPRNTRVSLGWFTAGGASISTTDGTLVADTTTGWTFISVSGVAPATTAFARLVVSIGGPPSASEVHYVDDPQMSVLPASVDHTAPYQYPWDWRIAPLLALQQALTASPPGVTLAPAYLVTSGAATATWTPEWATDLAACAAMVTVAQPAPAGPSSGWPHVTTEAAFGAGLATPWDELTWTDLTARDRAMSGPRGKQYELDSVQASSASWTFANNDGALTPAYSGSAYDLGLSDWAGGNNAVASLSPLYALTGRQSLLLAPDGITASPFAISGQYAVPASLAGWSGQAAAYSASGYSAGIQVQLNWYDNTHSFLSATSGATTVLLAGQWAYPTVTAGTPPVGAAYVVLVLHVNGTPAAGTLTWWDSCYLTDPYGKVVNSNPVFSAGPDVYTPIRKTATWQGRAYPQYRGFAERWPQGMTSSRYTQANATATDVYAGLTALLPGPFTGEVLNDDPWGYWPCNDSAGSSAAANKAPGGGAGALQVVTSKYGPGPSGAQAFGANSGAFAGQASDSTWQQSGLNTGSTDMQHGYCLQLQATSTPSVTGGLTVECWANLAATQPNGQLIVWALQGGPGTMVKLWADYDGSGSGVGWYLSFTDKGTRAVTSYKVWNVGVTGYWAHFAVTLTQTAWSFTIDGGAHVPDVPSGTANLAPAWQWITFGGSADRVLTGGASNISLYGLALYPRVLSQSRILAHYSGAAGGFGGDGEGSRMTRLLSYANMLVPRRLGLGPDVIGPATDIAGQAAAQNVTNIAQSGAGLLYADRCGYLAFQSRDLRWNKPAAWSVGEQAGALLNFNRDFETGVSPWAGHNGAGGSTGIALSASSAFAWTGSQSLLMIPDGVTAGVGAISEKCAIPASAAVTGSARLYCPAGYATGGNVAINWYDSTGAFISATTGTTTALPVASWLALTVSGTAPGGARFAALLVQFAGTPAASAFAYADLAILTQSGEIPYLADVGSDYDPSQVYNDLTVSQSNNGVTVATSSATSIGQLGDLTLQETVYLNDPDAVRDLANRVLADYGQPSTRIAQFTVDAAANAYAWQFVLSVDVGTVVNLSRRLQGTQAVISAPFVIQSVSPSNAPGQWQVRYTATPYLLGALATNDSVRGLPNGSTPIGW